MKVAILKYNAGNTASVMNALNRLGVEPAITDSPTELAAADKVIFPGVGEARSAMRYLTERGLDRVIRDLTQPVLGICLGMQLLCASSEEHDTECLGIVPLRVRRFPDGELKVPHVGWNNVTNMSSPIFADISEGEYFYFVHGYYVEIGAGTAAIGEYGTRFTAALQHGNFHGVQFHAEKSGTTGARLIENFLKL